MNHPIVFIVVATVAVLSLSWSAVCSTSEFDCPEPNPPSPSPPCPPPPSPNPPPPCPNPPPPCPPTPGPSPSPPSPGPRVSCDNVEKKLRPCGRYIKGKTKLPSVACCVGVEQIIKNVNTKAEKRALCRCIQKCLEDIHHYDKYRIPKVPKRCGFKFKIPPIDAKTKCSKITMFEY